MNEITEITANISQYLEERIVARQKTITKLQADMESIACQMREQQAAMSALIGAKDYVARAAKGVFTQWGGPPPPPPPPCPAPPAKCTDGSSPLYVAPDSPSWRKEPPPFSLADIKVGEAS